MWLSSCVNGFFNSTFGADGAEQKVASKFNESWLQAMAGLEQACDKKAAELRALGAREPEPEDGRSVPATLESHAARLRAMSPTDAASGKFRIFEPWREKTKSDDHFLSQYVPVMQWGRNPTRDGVFSELTRAAAIGDVSALPRCFAEMKIEQVDTPEKDKWLGHIFAKLSFVADAASAAGPPPEMIITDVPVIAMKVGLRDLAVLSFNTLMRGKAIMAMRELLKVANIIAFIAVPPATNGAATFEPYFPLHQTVCMRTTLRNNAATVSEEFARDCLAGKNRPFYSFNINEASGEKITAADERKPLPEESKRPLLFTHAFMAASEASVFEFENQKPPLGLEGRDYRVVFAGGLAKLATDEWAEAVNDTAVGERLVTTAAAAAGVALDVFMKHHALVYCVAVPAA